jgi:antitoxin PrlF
MPEAKPMIRLRSKGQITLPRSVRQAAHLEEGDPVEVEITDQGILLRPKKVIDSTQAWFWTPSWQAGEARAEKEIREGRTTVHESTEDFLAALDED